MPTYTGVQKRAFKDNFDVWKPGAIALGTSNRITGGGNYSKVGTAVPMHQQVRPNISQISRVGRMDEKTLLTADVLWCHEDEDVAEGYFLQRNQAGHPNDGQWMTVQGISQNFKWGSRAKLKAFYIVRSDAPPGVLP